MRQNYNQEEKKYSAVQFSANHMLSLESATILDTALKEGIAHTAFLSKHSLLDQSYQ